MNFQFPSFSGQPWKDQELPLSLKDKKFRDGVLQFAFVGAIVILFVTFFVTAKINLETQGITSGFGFLKRATGWSINFSLIEYQTNDTYLRALQVGFLNSMFVAAISLTLATIIGVSVGVMRTSGNGMAELIGVTFVEIFRNIPLLLQLFFWYALLTALPKPKEATEIVGAVFLTGRGIFIPGMNIGAGWVFSAIVIVLVVAGLVLWIRTARMFSNVSTAQKKKWGNRLWIAGLALAILFMFLGRIPETELMNFPYLRGLNYRGGIRISPELLACIVAISIYGAAYIAEIIRAGLISVSKGQSEAGRALGLSSWQIFSRIRLPLAIRAVMPTMINQYVWLLKATTIGIAIGFVDFFMVISTSINQSGQTLELIGILMVGFLIVNYSLAWVLNRVNDAIKLKGTTQVGS